MNNLEALIKSAITGDDQAFAEIIRRFQDMALGMLTLLSVIYIWQKMLLRKRSLRHITI